MKTPRGTYDLFFKEAQKHRFILNQAQKISENYGFSEVITPIFEHIEVFERALGETSDVINKEMYVFADRKGEKFVLRPEGTAGVARAFINANLERSLPVKLFYSGPMFRYERPQKGRFRQFYQFGVEFLGLEDLVADVEVILLGHKLFKSLGIQDKITLEINSMGDNQSRNTYRKELVNFLNDHKSSLSEHSLKRLKLNPLRILDSKDKGDQTLLKNAPKMNEFLSQESSDEFDTILDLLDTQKIAYKRNELLVRGFDYYSHCVFEFTSKLLGAQSAVMAGGRYNELISQIGGSQIGGVGWGAGVERIRLLLDDKNYSQRPVAIIANLPSPSESNKKALEVAEILRNKDIPSEIIYTGNLSKKIKKAQRINARKALIIEDSPEVTIRDLDLNKKLSLSLSDIKSDPLKVLLEI